MTTFDEVLEVLTEMGAEDVMPQTRLVDIFDSMEMAQLVLELEEAFGIEITDDDLHKMFTVSDIVTYADSHRAAV